MLVHVYLKCFNICYDKDNKISMINERNQNYVTRYQEITNIKQEAHEPHRSHEKAVQINKHI